MKKIIAITGFFLIFASQVLTTSAAYFNNVPVTRCDTQITNTLKIGSQGKDVFVLQNMLVTAGFLNASPNGNFGYQTASAVRAFQRSNEITPTGIVGSVTRDAVNERLCDTNLLDNQVSYDSYYRYSDVEYSDGYTNTYSNGTTYVGSNDPYVTVVTPNVATPAIYATPQNTRTVRTPVYSIVASNSSYNLSISGVSGVAPSALSVLGTSQSQITGTHIVYNPAVGYTYGITQTSGTITVTSPAANTLYREGDTVLVNWTSSNLSASTYTILLENNNTNQSKTVAILSGTSYSFVLTKELLDSICFGSCTNSQQNSFRVVITTPTTDIAGNTSVLRAPITPIIIKRPPTAGVVSLSPSKLPVDSGEMFKLYVNTPVTSEGETTLPSTYSIKLKATCPAGVTVKLAGVACGQDFVIPFAPISFQNEIPVSITNTSWYKQEVIFTITLTDLSGNIVGTANTKVVANPAPFTW